MTASELEAIAQALASSLPSDEVALRAPLLRLLANGRPVPREQLAAALHLSHDELDAALSRIPNVEYDAQGNIVASGLSLLPASHQFRVHGQELYTWCALDTLIFPVVLQQSAQVASRCPITGRMVQLTVTPERIAQLDPADALVSLVIPDASAACCDVRGAFCNHVHFLGGHDAGASWQAAHPEAMLLSVDDAYTVGRVVAQKGFRAA